MTELLLQIRCPPPSAFTASVVIKDGKVIQAAPILGFMKTGKWGYAKVRAHCNMKGWEITIVRHSDAP